MRNNDTIFQSHYTSCMLGSSEILLSKIPRIKWLKYYGYIEVIIDKNFKNNLLIKIID